MKYVCVLILDTLRIPEFFFPYHLDFSLDIYFILKNQSFTLNVM